MTVVYVFLPQLRDYGYRGETNLLAYRPGSAVWLTLAVIVLAIVRIMFTHAGK